MYSIGQNNLIHVFVGWPALYYKGLKYAIELGYF